MLEYVGPAVALLTGTIGIFYSRAGERQKLGKIGYLLLALVLIAGFASLYGVRAAKREAAEEAKRTRIEADKAALQLRRERKNSDTLRGLLMASAFSEGDSSANAILIFDLTLPSELGENEEDGPSNALAPLLSEEASEARLTFEITDILEIDYAMKPRGYGAAIEASYYEYDPKVCRLMLAGLNAPAERLTAPTCKVESGYEHNAMVEAIAPYRALIIDLPKRQSFWKMFSRIEQSQRSNPLGNIEIRTRSPEAARRVFAEAPHVTSTIKFFRPFESDDECVSSLLVELDLQPKLARDNTVIISIAGIKDYTLSFCEVRPI